MSLRDKTIEELEAMLYEAGEEEPGDLNSGYWYIIFIHEVLHNKYVLQAKRTGDETDQNIVQYSKKKLISEWIDYGTYLKKARQRGRQMQKGR
ncbi:hypothetical protein K8O68_07140 [Salipaludibacillus sp. CUR1]|uniref:hypothetical protein n=1 Tax=Salipaludibacillus sp. CUR1 TaxID=2820003 RepID=UPI001E352707|nr:hypothetical protein [Salipaludibacillus sp. CUR1]MCE7792199.1 hypothetical protein [Salipaludibacillus sp. CUR1]